MGRPQRVKPVPAGPSRRGFFKQTGAAAAALAAAPSLALADPGPHGGHGGSSGLFQHGVASGDPLADRVILWTRVTPRRPQARVEVRYVVTTDARCRRVVARGRFVTTPQRDYTVKVDVDGLRPGTTYYYRFFTEGGRSALGRTRTLPVGRTNHLRMAVVSCSNHAAGYFNAYARIAERADLHLVMHLGDYLYEYGAGQYGSVRTPEPATEMVTLADYRQRHAQYKRDADSQAMHRQHPLIAIWDDHETANNAWVAGAENHTEGGEGTWAARVRDALQAYDEWMPVRQPDPRDPRKENRAFAFGDLADLIMLEERLSARSQQIDGSIATPFGAAFAQTGAFADPTRQLLGAEQENWLFQRLRHTRARWKLLGQGVMFAQLKVPGYGLPNAAGGGLFLNSDQWDGYQPARNRVYAALEGSATQQPVDNVVVLTGDIHSSWAADLSPDPNNPDVASGGYNPATGEGSRAVEFVGTSVTSPGIDSDTSGQIAAALRGSNPHFKYVNLHRRGYMLVDVTRERALAEWWFVDTVASASHVETFAAAFETAAGSNRLQPAAMSMGPGGAALLAPELAESDADGDDEGR